MCVWVHAHMHVEVRGCLSLSSSALYFGTGSLIEPEAYQLVKKSWSTSSRGFPVSFSLELGLQMFATIPRCLCGFWELTFNLLKGCSLSTEELCYLFWLTLPPNICMPTLLTPIDIDPNVRSCFQGGPFYSLPLKWYLGPGVHSVKELLPSLLKGLVLVPSTMSPALFPGTPRTHAFFP